jgi:dTDP-4-amino-4,6-dideoxygalactose transaminase
MIPHSRPWLIQQDYNAVSSVMSSDMISSGAMNRTFARAVASYSGYGHAVACGSGTSALELLLRAMGIGKGDEVVVPVYVCRNVELAVRNTGAEVKFCDVSENWIMTPELAGAAISSSTKAIILVHIFGIDASSAGFHSMGIPVIHDLCQAFGLKPEALRKEEHAFCSFHATKCLTTGEGGAVLTNSETILAELQKLMRLRRCGDHLSDLASSLGLSQLSRYEEMLQKRRVIAERYLKELLAHAVGTEIHGAMKNGMKKTVWFRFPIQIDIVHDELIRTIESDSGVSLRRGVDALLGGANSHFNGAAYCYRHTLSLPIYPALSEKECTKVIETVNTYFSNE